MVIILTEYLLWARQWAGYVAHVNSFWWWRNWNRASLSPCSRLPGSKEGEWAEGSSVQSPSRVRLFETPWTTALQASLSITNSQSLLKLMSIELVMPSNHLILCCPLLLLPPTPPSIRVFSNESTLRMRWLNYWSFSFNISPSNEHPELIVRI